MPIMTATQVRIARYLSSDVLKEVDRLARSAKLSRSAFIEDVLRQHLEKSKRSL
jgi:metal-responsive CopG/Arc/MetJ family transcriptional regulator